MNTGISLYRDYQKGGKETMLWDQHVLTDRTVPNNKPEIIIRYNKNGTRVNRCCNFRI
jgi:hypothetical protein